MAQTYQCNEDSEEKEGLFEKNIVESKDSVYNKRCSIWNCLTTYKHKNKWGVYDHWHGTSEHPICGRCYDRINWKRDSYQ
ncbi:MAG: hypothetical protein ICV56_05545 [Nitrososphaeraceae archaeon]|nr:hypothetical protein [Nitrososphaeraceae archaeon]